MTDLNTWETELLNFSTEQLQQEIKRREFEAVKGTTDYITDRYPRLRPLADIVKELSDDDLKELILFAAYLNYRRRIHNTAEVVMHHQDDEFWCPWCRQWNGHAPNCQREKDIKRG